MMGKILIFWKKRKKLILIILACLLASYFLLVNLLVSAALVPSFMEKLEAFDRITTESYAMQVHTSDIKTRH